MTPPNAKDIWIPFATIGRPHGLKGELACFLFNPASENIEQLSHVRLEPPGKDFKLRNLRRAGKRYLIAFDGIHDRNAAAVFTKATLLVRRSQLTTPSSDELYVQDLMGMKVMDQDGLQLGRVVAIGPIGAHESSQDLVSIERHHPQSGCRGMLQVPLVSEFFYDYDFEANRIKVHLPRDMLELTEWEED